MANLEQRFNLQVTQLRDQRPIKHYSIFGLAPQPLSIKLGTLLGDIYAADVYQLKKEPQSTWAWLEEEREEKIEYIVRKPANRNGKSVVLKLSLSSEISDERIWSVLGKDCSIWELTLDSPHNDLIRKRTDLKAYRTVVRKLLDDVKNAHGEKVDLNIFPSMPISTSIELGRVWNPKSQLPLRLFDQNRKIGGFVHAFDIR